MLTSRAPLDPSPRFLRDDYMMAYVCPIGTKLAAMDWMLDEIHESLLSSRDQWSQQAVQPRPRGIGLAWSGLYW
jgi:hypothetical protein